MLTHLMFTLFYFELKYWFVRFTDFCILFFLYTYFTQHHRFSGKQTFECTLSFNITGPLTVVLCCEKIRLNN